MKVIHHQAKHAHNIEIFACPAKVEDSLPTLGYEDTTQNSGSAPQVCTQGNLFTIFESTDIPGIIEPLLESYEQ